MQSEHVDPHLFIVFGGTGDLMRRKLLPAIYHLYHHYDLSGKFKILGISRSGELDDESYRNFAQEALNEFVGESHEATGTWCNSCLHFQSIGKGTPEDFANLKKKIEEIEAEAGLPGNRVFYLALAPLLFLLQRLALATRVEPEPGLDTTGDREAFWQRPEYGPRIKQYNTPALEESQVYRIDHYLGKETVQNLLAFRFANPIFESIWNRDRVQNVQITVAERLGVGTRAGYYDKAGALRDMVQNHLTQLLTLTAMEAPATFDADAIRDEKVKVLKSIKPISPSDVIFGQYGPFHNNGQSEPGYLQESGVAPGSKTETFVGLRLEVANWRWQGVPFYLRTGKRMRRRVTQIVVTFRKPPISLFRRYEEFHINSNRLILTLQPDEGFDIHFDVKVPGQGMNLQRQNLRFRYDEKFGQLPDGYETLLHDIMTDDQTLFVRGDEVEVAWKLYEPLLTLAVPRFQYEVGDWGPQEANQLVAERGHRWVIG